MEKNYFYIGPYSIASILISISLLYLPFNLNGQDLQNTKSKSLQIGLGILQQQEQNLFPRTHKGHQVKLSYLLQREGNIVTDIETAISFAKIGTVLEENNKSLNLQAAFSVATLFPISKTDTWDFFVGPFINLHYNMSFYPNWDESHLYWANQLNSGIYTRITYDLGNRNKAFTWEMKIPVIGLLSRPETNRNYKIDDFSMRGVLESTHGQAQLFSVFQCFQFHNKLAYNFLIKKQKKASIGYQFSYAKLKTDYSNPLIQNSQIIIFNFSL
jgi:hypothetical protein